MNNYETDISAATAAWINLAGKSVSWRDANYRQGNPHYVTMDNYIHYHRRHCRASWAKRCGRRSGVDRARAVCHLSDSVHYLPHLSR